MTGTNLLNHIYVVAGFAAAASATLSIQEKPDLSLPWSADPAVEEIFSTAEKINTSVFINR